MKEKYYAIAKLFEAIKNKFGLDSVEALRIITPAEFLELSTAHGVDDKTVIGIYTAATSLVLGMIQYTFSYDNIKTNIEEYEK